MQFSGGGHPSVLENIFQLQTCHCNLVCHTQLTVHVTQVHKTHSIFSSPAPYARKHGHSTGPEEPRLQKSSGVLKRTWYTQPTSSRPPSSGASKEDLVQTTNFIKTTKLWGSKEDLVQTTNFIKTTKLWGSKEDML